MKQEIGGKRLGGAGKGMTVNLHEYNKSTHNLDKGIMLSLTPGVLYPIYYRELTQNSGIEIEIDSIVKALAGMEFPMFSSFKAQIDFFAFDARLYNKRMHNNLLGAGMNLEEIFIPQIEISGPQINGNDEDPSRKQIAYNSLARFCGVKGLGHGGTLYDGVIRQFNALPFLGYWDIFKNYYANKQEDDAYFITSGANLFPNGKVGATPASDSIALWGPQTSTVDFNNTLESKYTVATGKLSSILKLKLAYGNNFTWPDVKEQTYIGWYQTVNDEVDGDASAVLKLNTIDEWETAGLITPTNETNAIPLSPGANAQTMLTTAGFVAGKKVFAITLVGRFGNEISLEKFPLKNIDKMREDILGAPTTEPFVIDAENAYAPYTGIVAKTDQTGGRTNSANPLGGLAVKTYLSDRFNNWVKTDWITGENGIANITAIDTTSGKFTQDSLIMAKAIYDMLNRIAISGGTLNDTARVLYGETRGGYNEIPIYCGGASCEVVFNEVVSTAGTEAAALGQQGGIARSGYDKGGTIRIRANEIVTCVMGILSITPRLVYSQGNNWWTRHKSLADYHKPALDGIAYQDLLVEEMLASDTYVSNIGVVTMNSIGKQPAWIEYMTEVDEAYGSFANPSGDMGMTLNRRYTHNSDGTIADATTYIDPTKFNYAFVHGDLESENLQAMINLKITGRLNMGAIQIPNL